jgi:phage shock protein A
MALINRLSRLFKADLHAVLDRIEEPETLLKQSVREMEDALSRDRQHHKRVRHEHSEILAREKALATSLRDLEEELGSCFEFDREDLARTQIKRQLEMQRQQTFLAHRREALDATLLRQQRRIEENASRLQSMRQKAELLAADDVERAGHAAPAAAEFPTELVITEDEVEVAFLREKQRRGRS